MNLKTKNILRICNQLSYINKNTSSGITQRNNTGARIVNEYPYNDMFKIGDTLTLNINFIIRYKTKGIPNPIP